jgi:hypothetical protein
MSDNIHRFTFDAALATGCHWVCSTELAFLAVEAFTGQPGKYLSKPCTVCLAVWQAWKKEHQRQKGQTL